MKRKPSRVPAGSGAPAVYECECGATRHTTDGLPVGWATCRGIAWCDDCVASGVPARRLNRRAA